MSASNEWHVYHLTPRGWIAGSEKLDITGIKYIDIPRDRVLTLRFYEYLSSSFGPLEKRYEEQYRYDDEQTVFNLIEQFGEIPELYKEDNYQKKYREKGGGE